MLTIGKVAKLADVGVETVRFYERIGLLPEPPRSSSGYRVYTTDAVALIRFVRNAKGLGFTLGEIRDLLHIRVAPNATCAEVKNKASRKIADIDQKLEELLKMRKQLEGIVGQCPGQGPAVDCPILEKLETKELQNEN